MLPYFRVWLCLRGDKPVNLTIWSTGTLDFSSCRNFQSLSFLSFGYSLKSSFGSPSLGGDADAGYAIFDMIHLVKPPVWTIGMGLVASAVTIIQLVSPKERRVGLPNSHYLIRRPLSGIRGVATDIEIHARELEMLRGKINRLIADETGAPFAQVEKDTDRL
jgi:ATP-dependent Clp endopeptidase proteolytic subunit ClpP